MTSEQSGTTSLSSTHQQVTVFIIAISALRLVFPFLTNNQFSIFRDELYYLACADHLDFGYVDQSPLLALITALWRFIFGDSLISIRLLAAIPSVAAVALSGLLARQLGGGGFAQILTAVAVFFSPILVGLSNFLSMNVFDVLFWTLGAYVLTGLLTTGNQKLWLLFGIIVGSGLENKHSMVFFAGGVTLGLLLTAQRQSFRSKWFWLGVLIAFLLFLPNLLWQIVYDWPTLEFARNASQYKNLPLSPIQFIGNQFLEIHPILFPLLLLGLTYFFFRAEGRWRLFGWTYLAIFLLFIFTRSKTYYIAPLYPLMLAGGAVGFERLTAKVSWVWLRPASIALLIVGGLVILPLAVPILPIEQFIRYAETLGVSEPRSEHHQMGRLPQHYADMVGWEEMTATVASVYHSLTPEEQARCAIFGSNYGEAGAIDYFGKHYGLPKAIGRHNSYWMWGPRDYTTEIVITVGERLEDVQQTFEDVQVGAVFRNDYVMPYENNLPILSCRKPKLTMKEAWPLTKRFI